MGEDTRQRAADKIARLCAQPRDLVSLWRDVTAVLATAVPYWWTPCFYTLDPASLLMTSHFHEGLEEFPRQWLASEYYDQDVNQIADVARSPSGISTLHEATGGRPADSARWHRNMTMGGDQELIARLRTRSGQVWGALGLYRAPGEPVFNEREKAFIQATSPVLADGVRRAADRTGQRTRVHRLPGPAHPQPELGDRIRHPRRLALACRTARGRPVRRPNALVGDHPGCPGPARGARCAARR